MDARFSHAPSQSQHYCTSHREGEWIVWRCPHCSDYERRMNWQTGEMRIKRGASTAQHIGASTKAQNMEALQQIVSLN
ncbi:MAG: hypothetical protein LCH81_03855 [Bacteroidetes bacterium]|nr:hypothetical protein [Bacteroidota bacterium]